MTIKSLQHTLFGVLLLVTLLALTACKPANTAVREDASKVQQTSNASIEAAFANKRSDVQVTGQGKVVKLLADDNDGAKHQKFLVKINARQTLLFAHNIDLAPRVPLQVGDTISFAGEYIYNPKGGIVHWTHHAPQGDHPAGWIKLNEQTYQ